MSATVYCLKCKREIPNTTTERDGHSLVAHQGYPFPTGPVPTAEPTFTKGQRVTIEIRNAWHYGTTGRVTHVHNGIVTVTFSGKGSVHVPAAVVRPA